MEKNEIITLDITDVSADGSGIGHFGSLAVFVPDTFTGDRVSARVVKVKSNLAFAKCEKIITPSPFRIDPDCENAKQCGGCAFRHVSYLAELSFKQNRVKETMHRIGGVTLDPMPILYSSPERYRNKAQYPVRDGALGFYASRSHRVVESFDCLLQPAEFKDITSLFKCFMKKYNISSYNEMSNTGLVRHFYIRKGWVSGEIQVVIVANGTSVPHFEEFIKTLTAAFGDKIKSVVLNVNTAKNNVILGNRNILLYGREYIFDTLCGVKVRLSPNSFYQVNHSAAEMLYKKAGEYADAENKTVLDLYCGTGTIGLSLSGQAKQIIGVEIVENAVKDAVENAKENGITNARFICADAAAAAEKLAKENLSPDTVIIDPPRKGCEKELLFCVAQKFCPEKIVYVSCDVATLARDVKVLSQIGYTLKEYTPVDMFPRTAHVETVALLVRAVPSI